jgi:putative glutathione S-transferase
MATEENVMGVMIDGVWHVEEPRRTGSDGSFQRPDSPLRSWVTPDGAPGPSGDGGFEAAAGRYHLYVAEGCPWAHRTWIFRVLKQLEKVVSMSIVAPRRSEMGWVFDPAEPRYRDLLHGREALHELYSLGAPGYTGRVTVPVLWDKKSERIVSNESSEIIRMLGSAFDALTGNRDHYYPDALRGEIDAWNERIYPGLNNGVYRAGFAGSQEAYEAAVDDVFATLDAMEERLGGQRYLVGPRPSEADWRAFPTLVRFDVAYVSAFRCNLRRLVDYPNLWGYTRDLLDTPGVRETVFPELYKRGYHAIRGADAIVPKGPLIDWKAPHDRARLA